MEKEKKLVTLSMIILFFSLIVVYSVLYQVKGENIIKALRGMPSSNQQSEKGIETVESHVTMGEVAEEKNSIKAKPFKPEWDTISDTTTWEDALQVVNESIQKASSDTSRNGDSPIILSWTDLYFGIVDSIETLGLEPEYILKDYKGFYYAKFDQEPDVKTTVQKLGGNTYTITSEAELVRNELFGNKIVFINLPEYKNKTVVMLLSVNNQYWLIQMSYEKYHHAKQYLKNLFI